MHHQKIIVFRYHLYIVLLVLIRGIQKYWSRFSVISRFKVMHILRFFFFVVDIFSLKYESNEFDEIGSIVFLHNIGGEYNDATFARFCVLELYTY